MLVKHSMFLIQLTSPNKKTVIYGLSLTIIKMEKHGFIMRIEVMLVLTTMVY